MFNRKPDAYVKKDRVAEVLEGLQLLGEREVLVGFPEETSRRDGELDESITNAALGYIHENGDPDAKIPARPFMQAGMQNAISAVTPMLERAAKAALLLRGGKTSVEQHLTQIGLKVETEIKKKINEGIPPPLSPATLRKRAAKGRKGAQEELDNRAQGLPPSTQLAKPLIDTSEMRDSVRHVIRDRARRKD